MNAPRVSVITNVLNGAGTLSEAIESVLAQTFSDWELIIWDNGSTDGTGAVAAGHRDPRIRYFRKESASRLSQARAAAIREARGTWVAFLDHDDVWLPDKLAKQMALVGDDTHSQDLGILYGRTVAFSEAGREWDFDHRHEYESLPEGDIFERLFVDACFIAMSSVVIRKSAIEELGATPEAIDIIPDYYYYTFIARRYRARAVQEVVCRYRVHPYGLTATKFRLCHEEILWLLNALRPHLDPNLFERRIRIHQTLVAFEDLRGIRTMSRGLKRLVLHGSVPYLLSRPFARSYRAIKRRLVMPYWMKTHPPAAPTARASAE